MSANKSEEFYKRLYKLARESQNLVKLLPKMNYNAIYSDQLIRSSSSIGANYIEALDGLSVKDFIHRMKICRKETRN